MPGFFVNNSKTLYSMNEYVENDFIYESLYSDSDHSQWTFSRNTLNKFLKDKVFESNAQYVIVLEGYILNKVHLFKTYNVNEMNNLLCRMIEDKGETFFGDLRGCFSGCVLFKQSDTCIVFTNQIGDNPVFYYYQNGRFAAGSQVNYIVDWCEKNDFKLSFNESCALQLLTFGFVASDETYANEIRRLEGGDYLVLKDGKVQVKHYHKFKKRTGRFKKDDEAEIIEAIDNVFRKAVALEWDKDDEYALKHLADLSGGLDSRMSLWVAHSMKECKATVLTYSKAGYLDETIAEEIASYWGDELLFKPLDDASFMYDIDVNTALLGGLSLYSGITGGQRLLSDIKISKYGLEHTGMVGDVALGSFYKSKLLGAQKKPSGMYSEKLIGLLPESVRHLPERYDDYEIYLMYTRGFRGACNSHLIRRNYTEVASPFLYVDFLELCYSIPDELRINHNIYKKWILQKYPQAANFIWEKTGGFISESPVITNTRSFGKKAVRKAKKLLGKESYNINNMNPIDYWISKNKALTAYLDAYEKEGYSYLPSDASESLVEGMKALYANGNAMEKSMVLTVLSAVKMFFC